VWELFVEFLDESVGVAVVLVDPLVLAMVVALPLDEVLYSGLGLPIRARVKDLFYFVLFMFVDDFWRRWGWARLMLGVRRYVRSQELFIEDRVYAIPSLRYFEFVS
jgi:hypothetical protein